jgi:hypothetical protein
MLDDPSLNSLASSLAVAGGIALISFFIFLFVRRRYVNFYMPKALKQYDACSKYCFGFFSFCWFFESTSVKKKKKKN